MFLLDLHRLYYSNFWGLHFLCFPQPHNTALPLLVKPQNHSVWSCNKFQIKFFPYFLKWLAITHFIVNPNFKSIILTDYEAQTNMNVPWWCSQCLNLKWVIGWKKIHREVWTTNCLINYILTIRSQGGYHFKRFGH